MLIQFRSARRPLSCHALTLRSLDRIHLLHDPLFSFSAKVKLKVKCSRYRPGVAQRVGTGIALLFHDRGTRRE